MTDKEKALVAMAYKSVEKTCDGLMHRPGEPSFNRRYDEGFNDALIEVKRNLLTPPDAQAALEELEQDAKRYRWLRSRNTGPSKIWELLSDDCQPPYMTLKSEADLDAAIDATLNQQNGKD